MVLSFLNYNQQQTLNTTVVDFTMLTLAAHLQILSLFLFVLWL